MVWQIRKVTACSQSLLIALIEIALTTHIVIDTFMYESSRHKWRHDCYKLLIDCHI